MGDEGEMWPSALAVAELGAAAPRRRCHRLARDLPEPLYLRQADVRIGWEQVGGPRHRALQFRSGPAGPGASRRRSGTERGSCRFAVRRAQAGPMKAGTPQVGSRQVATEPMRRRHLPAVMRIERRAHPKPWSLGVFTSELAQGDARYYLVLKVDGKVAGYGGLMFAADEAHVTNIAIATVPAPGPGFHLLAELAREGTRRQCTAMTLEVRMGNIAAQDLYRKFGFVVAGVRRNYYPETGEDAFIMWLHELLSPEVQARLKALDEPL